MMRVFKIAPIVASLVLAGCGDDDHEEKTQGSVSEIDTAVARLLGPGASPELTRTAVSFVGLHSLQTRAPDCGLLNPRGTAFVVNQTFATAGFLSRSGIDGDTLAALGSFGQSLRTPCDYPLFEKMAAYANQK